MEKKGEGLVLLVSHQEFVSVAFDELVEDG